jgi:hypothetical protein
MDAEREREIRELAVRLCASKRHKRIGLVLGELLGEIDALRDYEGPSMSYSEAMAIIEAWKDRGLVESAERRASSQTWRKAIEAKALLY